MLIDSILKSIDRPEKMVPIFSALAATGLAAYCSKQLIGNDKSKQKDLGYEKIPVPDGEVFYLGSYIYEAQLE